VYVITLAGQPLEQLWYTLALDLRRYPAHGTAQEQAVFLSFPLGMKFVTKHL